MRILGVVLLSFLPVFTGVWYYNAQKARVEFINEFYLFICFIKEQIRFSHLETDRIMQAAKEQPRFNHAIKEICDMFLERPDENFENMLLKSKNIPTDREAFKLISDFFCSLGHSDVEGQTELCLHFGMSFLNLYKKRSLNFSQTQRLIFGLSFAGGAGIFVLLV